MWPWVAGGSASEAPPGCQLRVSYFLTDPLLHLLVFAAFRVPRFISEKAIRRRDKLGALGIQSSTAGRILPLSFQSRHPVVSAISLHLYNYAPMS